MQILKAVSRETCWHYLQPQHINNSVITLAITVWPDMTAKYDAVFRIDTHELVEAKEPSVYKPWWHQLKLQKQNEYGCWGDHKMRNKRFSSRLLKIENSKTEQNQWGIWRQIATLPRRKGIATRQQMRNIMAFIFLIIAI